MTEPTIDEMIELVEWYIDFSEATGSPNDRINRAILRTLQGVKANQEAPVDLAATPAECGS